MFYRLRKSSCYRILLFSWHQWCSSVWFLGSSSVSMSVCNAEPSEGSKVTSIHRVNSPHFCGCPSRTHSWYHHLLQMNLFTCGMFQWGVFEHSAIFVAPVRTCLKHVAGIKVIIQNKYIFKLINLMRNNIKLSLYFFHLNVILNAW